MAPKLIQHHTDNKYIRNINAMHYNLIISKRIRHKIKNIQHRQQNNILIKKECEKNPLPDRYVRAQKNIGFGLTSSFSAVFKLYGVLSRI